MTRDLLTLGRDVLESLSHANKAFQAAYPGDRPDRQPVHTVYGGAQLFKAETTQRLGELALAALQSYAPDALAFAHALQLPGSAGLPEGPRAAADLTAQFERDAEGLRRTFPHAWLACAVHARVTEKLKREPVEDFRIDFEDGYGNRPDDEEDRDAERSAREVARGLSAGLLPPFLGIRIKPLTEELKQRAIRTFDHFVSTLLEHTGGSMPPNFVITLPKVTIPEQVSAMVELCERFEDARGLARGSLRLELMIETTQSMIDVHGNANLPLLLRAGRGRVVGAHFGTYDYTASASVTAAYQAMDHPACDHARNMTMWSYGGRGLFLSDGATNVMPVGPHRAAPGATLTRSEEDENVRVVHAAWRLAYRHTRHSLSTGFYQGWDLHPAQLPVRYAACYAFFLEGFSAAAERLSNFVEKAAQATLIGDVFDDAATGQGLLNYFLRALNCGAVSLDDMARTGLTLEEIQLRSFAAILKARRARLAGTPYS
jgi:citrate lyase beta subunit